MNNPNAAAFLAVILICVGAFCAGVSPSFSYPTTYPNTVPITDPGQLQMQNPPVLGIGGEQIADNNKTNAEAYKSAQEGNAAIIEANAIGTLAAAEACKLHHMDPAAMPSRCSTGGEFSQSLLRALSWQWAYLAGYASERALHNCKERKVDKYANWITIVPDWTTYYPIGAQQCQHFNSTQPPRKLSN